MFSGACRGYRFDHLTIGTTRDAPVLEVATHQLRFEHEQLLRKLLARDPARDSEQERIEIPRVHPLFRVVPDPLAIWERRPA